METIALSCFLSPLLFRHLLRQTRIIMNETEKRKKHIRKIYLYIVVAKTTTSVSCTGSQFSLHITIRETTNINTHFGGGEWWVDDVDDDVNDNV